MNTSKTLKSVRRSVSKSSRNGLHASLSKKPALESGQKHVETTADTTTIMVVVTAAIVVVAELLYMLPYTLVFWHCDAVLATTADWQRASDLAYHLALPAFVTTVAVYSTQRQM